MVRYLLRLLEEQPLRLIGSNVIKRVSHNVRTLERWDAVERPEYLTGMLAAADMAKEDGVDSIYAIEFGVASGNGLLLMQQYAELIECQTGVHIHLAGFDSGVGLPSTDGNYREHPDRWLEGDYPMDKEWLRARLASRTELILGDVRDTVPTFVRKQQFPLGFLAMDLDLYSSTSAALRILTLPGAQRLRRTFMYFDDIMMPQNHRFAGERLAIDEFNCENDSIKIDSWYALRHRIFRDRLWVHMMYVAHDLEAISKSRTKRPPRLL